MKRKESLHLSSFHTISDILHRFSYPLYYTELETSLFFLCNPLFQRDDTQYSTMDSFESPSSRSEWRRATRNDTSSDEDEENSQQTPSSSLATTPTINRGRVPLSERSHGSNTQPLKRGAYPSPSPRFGRHDALFSSSEKQATLKHYPVLMRRSGKEYMISSTAMDTDTPEFSDLPDNSISCFDAADDTAPGVHGANTPSPLAASFGNHAAFSGQETSMSAGSILDGISPGTLDVFLNLSIDEKEELCVALFPHVHPNVSSFELDAMVGTAVADDTTPECCRNPGLGREE
jgi:hypothetical protein